VEPAQHPPSALQLPVLPDRLRRTTILGYVAAVFGIVIGAALMMGLPVGVPQARGDLALSWALLMIGLLVLAGLGVQHVATLRRAERGDVLLHQSSALLSWKCVELEDAIECGEERTRALISNLVEGVIGVDPAGSIRSFNSAAEKIFGYTAEEVIGSTLSRLLPGENAGVAAPMPRTEPAETMAYPPGLGMDCRGMRKDGSHFPVELSISIVGVGDQPMMLAIVRDTTERRLTEVEIAQSQKLESIGQLAAGIAHEINTPIQYVGDNTCFLQDAFKDLGRVVEECARLLQVVQGGGPAAEAAAEVRRVVDEIDLTYLQTEIPRAIQQSLDGVHRVATIVRAMKDFSHPETEEKTPCDLNRGIESTITIARNEWKYVAETVTDLDPDLPLVTCLPGEFNQVMLNLIVNAAHAIADAQKADPERKGIITVKTAKVDAWARIDVTDNGAGIPEHVRPRIFDPFFTTKPVGKGTGQGLAIARSIVVDKHGGQLRFDSEIGVGTTFSIRLPIDPPRPA
jgi:PAS domain S-box-containing protein